jgi:hypothetical protein
MLAGQALTAGVGTQTENCVKMMGNVRADGGKFGVLGAGFYQIVGALGQIEGSSRHWSLDARLSVGASRSCLF